MKAKLICDGVVVQVTITYTKGGELTDPDHCLTKYAQVFDFDRMHPLYIAMKQVYRFQFDTIETEECVVHVRTAIPL